jgi:outer membrane biosynthesis protein TonB
LTPQSVLDRINTLYMPGLQRCYRKGLVEDATLSGKVALAFTVDERGHVTDPEADGVGAKVDACISKQMESWQFSPPKDKHGASTEVTFKLSLALQAPS